MWHLILNESQGIIFMVDSSESTSFEDASAEFSYLLGLEELR
jgi:signal recognition particle receptor subunit beta